MTTAAFTRMHRAFAALGAFVALTFAAPNVAVGAYLLADPLPLGASEALLLVNAGQPCIERIDWRTGQSRTTPLPFLPVADANNRDMRYTLAANSRGIWLVGPKIVLIEKDGQVLRTDFGGNQPTAVGLDDGSLLVFGKDDVKAVYRASRRKDGSGIDVREIAKPKEMTGATTAVKLADGSVLAVNGYSGDRRTWIYDAHRDAWQPGGATIEPRVRVAIAALPDGRAIVAGSGGIDGDRGKAAHSAEIRDPASGRWQRLPPLPLSFNINAYRARAPSAAGLPDGSLLLGGAMHRQILLLRARGKGYADHWTVAATLPVPHVGGIIQPLGRNEAVVIGGYTPVADGGCCTDQIARTRIAWPTDGGIRAASLGLLRHDAAVAHRGAYSFVAGGWEAFSLSSTSIQTSAVAELVDRRGGGVRELPPMPAPLLTGRAEWLDDDRVLVKAVGHSALYETPFGGMDGRGLEGEAAGFLAIYSLRQNAWRRLNDPRLALAGLVGVRDGTALLIDPEGAAWSVDTATLDAKSIRELPRMTSQRVDGTQRLLADGRIVAAGGTMQTELIAVAAPDCEPAGCPDVYQGFGPRAPADRHEIFDPAAQRWRFSAPGRGAGISAVIHADGRVVKLGTVRDPNAPAQGPGADAIDWIAEESDAEGAHWQELPLPAEINRKADISRDPPCGRSDGETRCVLLLGQAERDAREYLILRVQRWDSDRRVTRYDLWLYDPVLKQWLSAARDLAVEELAQERALPGFIAGSALRGALFHPGQLRIWRN